MKHAILNVLMLVILCPLISWGKACLGSAQPTGSYNPDSGLYVSSASPNCDEVSFQFDTQNNMHLRVRYKTGDGPMFGLNVIQFRSYQEARLFKDAMNSPETFYVVGGGGCSESGTCVSDVKDNFLVTSLHNGGLRTRRNELLQSLAKDNSCTPKNESQVVCKGITYQRVAQ